MQSPGIYDGEPEAESDIAATVARIALEAAEYRSKLTVPGEPGVIAGLASSYSNPDLGALRIERKGEVDRLYAVSWDTAIVTRRNDDGTVSLVASEAELVGLELLVGEQSGKRTLTLRDGQHVYVFTESSS